MRSIYLLRHCSYSNPRHILAGRLPLELSANGRQDAEGLRLYFANKQLSKIYSSAVLRCKQTAEIIGAGTIPVVCDQRLLEALSAYQGYWEENWHGDGFHFFSHKDELGGEGFSEVWARIAQFWDQVVLAEDGNLLICGHGDPLQLLYRHIHRLPPVREAEPEEKLAGWLQPGEFIEITLDKGELRETTKPVNIHAP